MSTKWMVTTARLGLLVVAFAAAGARAEDPAPPLVVAATASPVELAPAPAAVAPAPVAAAPAPQRPAAKTPVFAVPALADAGWTYPPPGAEGGPEVSAAAAVRAAQSRIGLLVGMAGAQQPVHAELAARLRGWASVGLGFGVLPSALGAALLSAANVQGGKLSSWSLETAVQLFPFRGSFFLGTAVGLMSLSASAATQAGAVTLDVTSIYVTPRLGWLATWDSGFTLGFDMGAQVPLTSAVGVTGPSQAASNLESVSRLLATTPLPTVALRLGWLL